MQKKDSAKVERITVKSRDFVRGGLGDLLDAVKDGADVGIVSPYRHPGKRFRLVAENNEKNVDSENIVDIMNKS